MDDTDAITIIEGNVAHVPGGLAPRTSQPKLFVGDDVLLMLTATPLNMVHGYSPQWIVGCPKVLPWGKFGKPQLGVTQLRRKLGHTGHFGSVGAKRSMHPDSHSISNGQFERKGGEFSLHAISSEGPEAPSRKNSRDL